MPTCSRVAEPLRGRRTGSFAPGAARSRLSHAPARLDSSPYVARTSPASAARERPRRPARGLGLGGPCSNSTREMYPWLLSGSPVVFDACGAEHSDLLALSDCSLLKDRKFRPSDSFSGAAIRPGHSRERRVRPAVPSSINSSSTEASTASARAGGDRRRRSIPDTAEWLALRERTASEEASRIVRRSARRTYSGAWRRLRAQYKARMHTTNDDRAAAHFPRSIGAISPIATNTQDRRATIIVGRGGYDYHLDQGASYGPKFEFKYTK